MEMNILKNISMKQEINSNLLTVIDVSIKENIYEEKILIYLKTVNY